MSRPSACSWPLDSEVIRRSVPRTWRMARHLGISALFWVLSLCESGCGVALQAGRPASTSGDAIVIRESQTARCVRSPHGRGSTFREGVPGPVVDPGLLPHLARFTPEVGRTAVAAGVEPLLAQLLRERARAHGEPTPLVLELRQRLAERVAALSGQLLAVEFECECIVAAIGDALEVHEDGEEERERALTIATLVTGAGLGLVAGGWDLANSHTASPDAPDGPLVTAIVGGLVTTALGAAILVPSPRPLVFVHEHNLLAPIASGSDEGLLYPTFVFRLFTLPAEGGGGAPRDALLREWRATWGDSVDDPARPLAEAILYGAGGTYDPPLLALRMRLFEELETMLDSFSRHVDALSRGIADALDDEPVQTDAAPALSEP